MSRHTLAIERGRLLRRFTRRDDGAVAIEFAFIVPALILFTLGILEFGLILFDYHRAGEATRRASRLALTQAPLAVLNTLRTTDLTCTAAGDGAVNCTNNTEDDAAKINFKAILEGMQAIFPDILATNVQIGYVASGIDDVDNVGIVTALVTVSLTGVSHSLIALSFVPGVPKSITLPTFSTSALLATEAITPP